MSRQEHVREERMMDAADVLYGAGLPRPNSSGDIAQAVFGQLVSMYNSAGHSRSTGASAEDAVDEEFGIDDDSEDMADQF